LNDDYLCVLTVTAHVTWLRLIIYVC